VRDFATEVRSMSTAKLLILLAYGRDRDVWVGDPLDRAAQHAAKAAIIEEIDRRIPVPA
jgi:hypothetical protein